MASFGGLISGVMKGAASGAAEYAKVGMNKAAELDLRKEMLKAEEEKQLRVDEITRSRDVADIGNRTQATAKANLAAAPIVGQTAVASKVAEATAVQGSGLPELQAKNKAAELKANEANVVTEATQKGKAEGAATTATINTPGYLKAVKDKALAGHIESSGSLAQAALANFELGQKKNVASLNTALSKETDPAKRETLTQQIRDLSGGSTKSYSDVVAMGNGYVSMAGKLRAQAKEEMDPDSKASLNAQATQYEDAANNVFQTVSDRRLGPTKSGDKPATGGKPDAGKAPYKEGTRLSKQENGKTVYYVVKNGVPVAE